MRGRAKCKGQIKGLSGRQVHGSYGGIGVALHGGRQLVVAGRQASDQEDPIRAGSDGLVDALLDVVHEDRGSGCRQSRRGPHDTLQAGGC
jgi:hypothetical protein